MATSITFINSTVIVPLNIFLFRKPSKSRKVIQVFCSAPSKISKVDVVNLNVNNIQIKRPIVNKKTGRIMTYGYRDFNLVTTIKDSEGRTFDNTSSLEIRVAVSNSQMAMVGDRPKVPYNFKSGVSSDFKIPIRGENCFIFILK